MKAKLIALIFMVCSMSAMAQTPLEQRVIFQPDSVNIPESQIPQVEMMVDYMKNHSSVNLIVAGFVSVKTNPSIADEVASKRAEAVRSRMVDYYGIKPERITAIGVGVSKRSEHAEFNEVVSFFKK